MMILHLMIHLMGTKGGQAPALAIAALVAITAMVAVIEVSAEVAALVIAAMAVTIQVQPYFCLSCRST
jgi:hypothetical protein